MANIDGLTGAELWDKLQTINETTGYPEDARGNPLTDRVLLDTNGRPVDGQGNIVSHIPTIGSDGSLQYGGGTSLTGYSYHTTQYSVSENESFEILRVPLQRVTQYGLEVDIVCRDGASFTQGEQQKILMLVTLGDSSTVISSVNTTVVAQQRVNNFAYSTLVATEDASDLVVSVQSNEPSAATLAYTVTVKLTTAR